MTDPRIYQIGLTMINGVGDITAHHLLEACGDPEQVFAERSSLLERIPGIGSTLIKEIKRPEVLNRAERELKFLLDNRLRLIFWNDDDYPFRLKECVDAPLVLYYKGNADLNGPRCLSVVGTRRATDYGRTLTEHFIKGMAEHFPDTLIISGLAYGIDVCAHRAALANHLPTVGVLAHGLDRLYPPAHRSTAVEMLERGGLLTDFPSVTNPDRPNFLRRNRVIAGLAEATIVVESAEKGGSLVTADLAHGYNREVLTFPGRTTDPRSKGCLALIREQKATLITSADDLIATLGWSDEKKSAPMQGVLPFSNNPDNDPVLHAIREAGEIQVNTLSRTLDIPFHRLTTILFELEMEGLIQASPGGMYKTK